ncbi:MAG: three-Cys-motif partner protein TcmP [Terracidiphilus sp.]|jgi:three-Cys-motif partner protein
MENKTLLGEDDGLLIPDDLGPWTEDKSDLIRNYCQIFSSAMKNKWTRVYVDLYAGSGLCRIEGRRQVLLGSPLIALSVDAPFDSYIFCESDPNRFSALKARVGKSYSHLNTELIPGKFEEHIDEICSRIPAKSLALCFVDPFDCDFNIDDLKTISKSAHGVDFLCLLALQMDAKRNVERYLQPDSKIDRMIGNTTWRERWNSRTDIHEDFAKFLAMEFARSMSEVGYLETPLHQMKEVRTHDKNVPLYYIAMFSKHLRAYDLWKKALTSSSPQRPLPF